MTQIKLRRGTAAQWASANPVLASGEPGFETDTGRQKIGDGVSAWGSLAYAAPSTGAANTFVAAQTISVPAAAGNAFVVKDGTRNVAAIDLNGSFHLGHGSAEALIKLRGVSDQVQWVCGLDVANAPTYSDFVIAGRAETWDAGGEASTGSDFLVIRNGHSVGDPPRLGVGVYPTDADNSTVDPTNKGVVESGVWTSGIGPSYHNFLARVRNNDAPLQTGYAFAVSTQTQAVPFAVDVNGNLMAHYFTNQSLDDPWVNRTNMEAAIYVRPYMASTRCAIFRAAVSQSDDIFTMVNSSTVVLQRFDKNGYQMNAKTTPPADADLNSNELAIWSDDSKVYFKKKTSTGSVVSAEVALT